MNRLWMRSEGPPTKPHSAASPVPDPQLEVEAPQGSYRTSHGRSIPSPPDHSYYEDEDRWESEGGAIRPYRSQAEKVAVVQRNIQIGLSLVILAVGVATLLATLGVLG